MRIIHVILFLSAIWPCKGSSPLEIVKKLTQMHQTHCKELDIDREQCESDLFANTLETHPYSCEHLHQVLNCSRPWLQGYCVQDPRFTQKEQRAVLIFNMMDRFTEFERCMPKSDPESCVVNELFVEARNGTKNPSTGVEIKRNLTGSGVACDDEIDRIADNSSLYIDHAWYMCIFSQSVINFFFALALFSRSKIIYERKWSLRVTEECLARQIVSNSLKTDFNMRKSTMVFNDKTMTT